MKNLTKTIALSALAVVISASCEKADALKDYGFPKIYIPQATTTGLDNSYLIPGGPFGQNSTYTCRFEPGTGILDIALGVNRSGYLSESKAFSVKLSECPDETERKLAEFSGKGTSATALPSDCCTIPAQISVEKGQHSGSCYISVDMNALSARKASLMEGDVYKILVMGLEISDPSEYELAESNTSVVIVLDLNSTYWEEDVRTLFPTD